MRTGRSLPAASIAVILLLTVSHCQHSHAAYFQRTGNVQVPGISAQYTFAETMILIDRTDALNSYAKLNNGEPAYAEEYSLKDNGQRALDVITNTFCSSGQIVGDGSLINMGGTTLPGNQGRLLTGASSVRRIKPHGDFELIGELTSKRWYPTSQILPDGRIFIVGGADVFGNIGYNMGQTNNPTYEFWPRRGGEGNYHLGLLDDRDNIPFNLYPFVHLLPSGNLFIFAGQKSVVLDYKANRVVKNLPDLGPGNVRRNYPVTGTSALLPLTPENGYKAAVIICGGADTSRDDIVSSQGGGNGCPACYNGASDSCGSIHPDDNNPGWTMERMVDARIMPDAVLLLDDTMLIANGAGRGFQGLKQFYAGNARTKPMIYDPNRPVGGRFRGIGEDSGIARMYHSLASILADGSVYIGGSNPNNLIVNDGAYPTEFRTQRFIPDYLQSGAQQNTIQAPGNIGFNGQFQITVNTPYDTPGGMADKDRFRVVLVNPGFSTHSQRHGMRNVRLVIKDVAAGGAAGVRAATNTTVFANIIAGRKTLELVRTSTGASSAKMTADHNNHNNHDNKNNDAKKNDNKGDANKKGDNKGDAKNNNNKGDAKKNDNNAHAQGGHNNNRAGGGYTLTVQGPPSGNIAPGGYYWLHVLDQAAKPGTWVPAVKGLVVKLG